MVGLARGSGTNNLC